MIITRPAWGAAPAVITPPPIDRGTLTFLTIHGAEDPAESPHSACADWMVTAQLDAIAEGDIDIPWTAVLCPHGDLYDARGISSQPGGTVGGGHNEVVNSLSLFVRVTDLNSLPTDKQLWALQWFVNGYAKAIYPELRVVTHRDWDPTQECPGAGLVEALGAAHL